MAEPADAGASALRSTLVTAAVVVAVVVLAIVPLLTPLFIHPALDAAGSASWLGLDAAAARQASDRAVGDLLSVSGTFDLAAPSGEPFFDASERAHLRDARTLLWVALLAGSACAGLVILALARARAAERRSLWQAVSRGGAVAAIGAVVLGLVGIVAFGSLFTLFHEIAFPAGGWSFDPTSQRLVQLYPLAFWQVTATALGLLVVVIGMLVWGLARAASRGGARPDEAAA
jgi:hypothetical protein